MHVESNALRQRFVPQPMLRSSWPQFVMFGLGVDSWRERAISEVRGLRDERGPTQLGIYTRTSMDPRNALRLSEDDRRKNNTVIAGLDPAIHKHKALAHDMHAESNALRQRFVPQPANVQGRPLVKLATACTIRVFSKTSESESYSKKRGENFLSVQWLSKKAANAAFLSVTSQNILASKGSYSNLSELRYLRST